MIEQEFKYVFRENFYNSPLSLRLKGLKTDLNLTKLSTVSEQPVPFSNLRKVMNPHNTGVKFRSKTVLPEHPKSPYDSSLKYPIFREGKLKIEERTWQPDLAM